MQNPDNEEGNLNLEIAMGDEEEAKENEIEKDNKNQPSLRDTVRVLSVTPVEKLAGS